MQVSCVDPVLFTAVRTCSSSSVRFSPSSLATLFRFLKEILPVSSSSKSRKAFRISSLESFSAWIQGREWVHPALQGLIVAKVQRRKTKTPKHARNMWWYYFPLKDIYHFLCHDTEEIGKGDFSRSIFVHFVNHLFDLLLLRFEAQSSHCNLEQQQKWMVSEAPPQP